MHKKRKISGVHASSTNPCDKNEANKKNYKHIKNIIDGRKAFIRCIQKTGIYDFDKLWVNDSGHNEGTIYLVNGWINAKGMVFEHGAQMGTLKLAIAEWYSGLVVLISSIVGLLILYS